MRYTLTALTLAAALITSGAAVAQTAKPASTASAKPAALHSVEGTVKSVDASSLVLTKSGRKGGDMSFTLDSSTQRGGTIAVGSKVSVRYHQDGATMMATAVNAESPKTQAKK